MNNNGDNGNHPFSPGSKNSWLRKKTKTKKTNIFSAAVRDVCKSHRNPFIMLTAIFNLNQRQRKGTNKTQKLTRKATGYCRVGDRLTMWPLHKYIQITTLTHWKAANDNSGSVIASCPWMKTSLELKTIELNRWDPN